MSSCESTDGELCYICASVCLCVCLPCCVSHVSAVSSTPFFNTPLANLQLQFNTFHFLHNVCRSLAETFPVCTNRGWIHQTPPLDETNESINESVASYNYTRGLFVWRVSAHKFFCVTFPVSRIIFSSYDTMHHRVIMNSGWKAWSIKKIWPFDTAGVMFSKVNIFIFTLNITSCVIFGVNTKYTKYTLTTTDRLTDKLHHQPAESHWTFLSENKWQIVDAFKNRRK